ncbi:MAG: YggT family protein [Pseudomonadales bacterium]|jgi:YggT family protein|nr:YggT family protein [Pseudomonadales bacterium]
MNNAIGGAGYFLVTVLFNLATFAFLVRFILQAVRADFYNPITQGIVRLTDPVLRPLRRLIPSAGGLDLAALLVAILLQMLAILLFTSGASIVTVLLVSAFKLLSLVLDIYFWALVVIVIISWVAPGTYNPAAALLQQITEPLLAPFRRLIPPVGGLDFSVMVAFLVLIVIRDYLLPGLLLEVGLNPGLL